MARKTSAEWLALLRAHWSVVGLIAVAVVYFTVVTLLHTSATSPIDEWVYLDYLVKIPQQGMVFGGELVGPETLKLMSCHGTSPFGPIGTACGLTPNPIDFPNHGKTTADTYSPIYFYVTFALSWLVRWIPGISALDAWRLTGVVWAVAAVFLLWRLMRLWGARNLVIFAFGIAFLASPFAWWSFTYVSTDAPAFAFGALLLIMATHYVRGEMRGWPLVVVAVVATLVKSVLVVGVALVALFLVIEAITRARRRASTPAGSPWRLVITAVSAVIAAVAASGLWLAVAFALRVSLAVADQGIDTPLTLQELLLQLTNFMPSAMNVSAISDYTPAFVFAPLGWLCIAAVLGAAFLVKKGAVEGPLVVTTVVGVAVSAPLLALSIYATTGGYFQLPARYGAALLPAMLVCGAFIVRNRWMPGVVIAYAVSLLGVGVWLSGYLATLAP